MNICKFIKENGEIVKFKAGQPNWYIVYDYEYNKWIVEYNFDWYNPCNIYISLKSAKKLAEMLNQQENKT